MDEKKPVSAWDDLVEELGVEADPHALERRQPKPTDLPSVSRSSTPDKPPQAPKAKPGDWNALAGSLGVEVPPPAAVPKGRDPDEELEAAQEKQGEPVDELPELRSEFDKALVESTGDSDLEDASDLEGGMSGEAARTAFDALFAETASEWALPTSAGNVLDTPLEFSQFTEEGAASDEIDSDIAEEEPTTGRPKRRRPRRRRRGRGGRSGEVDKAKDEQQVSDDGELDEVDEEDREESTDAETSKDEKPRRRRPRRRKRRGEGEERVRREKAPLAEDEDEDADEVEDDAASVQQNGPFDLDDDDEDDEDEDIVDNGADDSGSSRQRANHRNLPTWSDAIGVIVDANLQQRSKSPSKPSSPRGRGRGGRGRKRS